MPAFFVGHGSPTNAIEENEYGRAWADYGTRIPESARAIVVLSAHWETPGIQVTAMQKPRTIHDFYGFPEAMYAMHYDVLGSAEIAAEIRQFIGADRVELNHDWGLDHGAWSILVKMLPQSKIPVLQMSLSQQLDLKGHYELGQKLSKLREQGIVFLGSGDIVHNLREVQWRDAAWDWAVDFDNQIVSLIQSGRHEALMDINQLGPYARRAIPSLDHWIPLLYILGMQTPLDRLEIFNRKVTLGAISMTSVALC